MKQAEFKRGIDDWRFLVPRYLARFGFDENNQIYCFGTANGGTMLGLVLGFSHRCLRLPHLHIFDSFLGLPAEHPDVKVPPIWNIRAFAAPPSTLNHLIRTLKLPDENYSIHNGWFKDTLQSRLVENGTFRRAVYVDIDADLYGSTVDALDFMFGTPANPGGNANRFCQTNCRSSNERFKRRVAG